MPKIKIKDLPEELKVSEEELAKVRGGMGGGGPGPAGLPTGRTADCYKGGLLNPAAGKILGPGRCM